MSTPDYENWSRRCRQLVLLCFFGLPVVFTVSLLNCAWLRQAAEHGDMAAAYATFVTVCCWSHQAKCAHPCVVMFCDAWLFSIGRAEYICYARACSVQLSWH